MRAAISYASAGTTAIVTPAADKLFRVHAIGLVAAGSTTVTLKSNTTALTGAMSLVVGVPLVIEYNDHPTFMALAKGDALNLTNGSAVQVSGWVEWEEAAVLA